MVPYAAQGAAAALEDAAGLAEALAALPVVDALKVYEQVRKPRTTKIAEGALENRRVFHMRDGEGQRERDRMVKAKWGEVSRWVVNVVVSRGVDWLTLKCVRLRLGIRCGEGDEKWCGGV